MWEGERGRAFTSEEEIGEGEGSVRQSEIRSRQRGIRAFKGKIVALWVKE